MIVVGIDPSLSNTAVCIGSAEGYAMQCFHAGKPADSVQGRTARFETLVAQVVEFIEANGPVELVAIEGYSYGSTGGAAWDRAEYRGILNFHLIELAPHIYEVAPLTLKKFVLGKIVKRPKGAPSPGKTPIITRIGQDYGETFTYDDEFDAFALWRLGLCLAGRVEPKNRPQRECVDTLLGVKSKADPAQRRVERLLGEELPF